MRKGTFRGGTSDIFVAANGEELALISTLGSVRVSGVGLVKAIDRRLRNVLCSPPHRDPSRRCGGLFAPDRGGRRGDARKAQSTSRAVG
jgi:hypothetical protein